MRASFLIGLLLAACANNASAAGHLVIEGAWIRNAPPGAMMLAGYASVRNDGDAAVIVTAADSADFASVSLHESIEEGGVVRMRALDRVEIKPGASVAFAPGGKHLMLMRPKHELKPGDSVKIHLSTNSGGAAAEFIVRDAP
ncbi:MAG: copper chaperone PCu(A)C [Gammaproteobacteria bacterium]|nr:MAG: copper chaperone PCu(A)C [Gammaproteobacteria bacterium]